MDLFIYYYYALGVGGEDREIEEEKEGKERGQWGVPCRFRARVTVVCTAPHAGPFSHAPEERRRTGTSRDQNPHIHTEEGRRHRLGEKRGAFVEPSAAVCPWGLSSRRPLRTPGRGRRLGPCRVPSRSRLIPTAGRCTGSREGIGFWNKRNRHGLIKGSRRNLPKK